MIHKPIIITIMHRIKSSKWLLHFLSLERQNMTTQNMISRIKAVDASKIHIRTLFINAGVARSRTFEESLFL